MGCPICDNKPANCDCTAKEREQFDEIESLKAEIARLDGALNVVAASLSDMKKGLEKHLLKLPPGPETKEVGHE
jgi:hypothetical protein